MSISPYFIWIPILIVLEIILGFISANSKSNGVFWFKSWYFWCFLFVGMMVTGTWYYITLVTKNMMFDSLLFDVVVAVGFSTTLIYVGQTAGFSLLQYVGAVMIIFGLILMR